MKVILLLIVLAILFTNHAFASSAAIIRSDVQISICGNSRIESGEDCENTDLNSQTCSSLGYISGTLTCDTSCSYNLTNCLGITPTLRPTTSLRPSLPKFLVPYDTNYDNLINTSELYQAIKAVVDSWQQSVTEEIPFAECDLNHDNVCNLMDLSILLFYINRK